jgi:hypothetical protein
MVTFLIYLALLLLVWRCIFRRPWPPLVVIEPPAPPALTIRVRLIVEPRGVSRAP